MQCAVDFSPHLENGGGNPTATGFSSRDYC